MKRPAFILVFVSSICSADPKAAEKLAVETYNHLVSYEGRLDAAIRSGDRDRFYRFVMNPTVDMRSRWPVPFEGDDYRKYARCYYALDGFRIYSEDQYKARGQMPKDNITARDYFDQKAQCKKALKGKV